MCTFNFQKLCWKKQTWNFIFILLYYYYYTPLLKSNMNILRYKRIIYRNIRHSFLSSVSASASACNKLAIIGGGNMAEGYLRALKDSQIQDMNKVMVVDINEDRLKVLRERYGIHTTLDSNFAVENADIVLLACKPQNVEAVASSLVNPVKGQILSIVAGATVSFLCKQFSTKSVIRCMPNTPASILEGMTVWYATQESNPEQVQRCRFILESTGDAIRVIIIILIPYLFCIVTTYIKLNHVLIINKQCIVRLQMNPTSIWPQLYLEVDQRYNVNIPRDYLLFHVYMYLICLVRLLDYGGND
jgi:hypothetical protein